MNSASATQQVEQPAGTEPPPATPPESVGPRLRPAPLVPPALGFIAGLVLSESLPAGHWATAAASAVAVTAIGISLCLYRTMPQAWLRIAVIAAAIGVGFVRHQSATSLPANHVGRFAPDRPALARIAGVIVRAPNIRPAVKRNAFLPYEPLPRTNFVLRAEQLRNNRVAGVCGLVRVSVSAACADLNAGDHVVATGTFYRPSGPRNPGEFDWSRWNRLQGVHAAMFIEAADLIVVEQEPGLAQRLSSGVRVFAQSMLFEPFSGAAGDEAARLLDTMILGHRSAASAAMNEAFLRTGSMHLLAVSGFHAGLLAIMIWFFVGRVLRRGERTTAAVTGAVLVLYAFIAEPNAPILRATIMGVLYCAARIAGRPACRINWLASSALLILVLNPLDLFRAGFSLSFLLVLALITIVPAVYRALFAEGRIDEPIPDARSALQLGGRWLAGGVVVTGVAWVVSLPLALYHFERFAPWAPLQALAVTPLATLTIVLGFATMLVGALPDPFTWPLAAALRGMTTLLLWVVDWLAGLPGTLIEVSPPPVWLMVATYGLAKGACWNYWRVAMQPRRAPVARRILVRPPFAILGTIAMLWATVYIARSWSQRERRDVEIHVLAVGDGSAALARLADGHGFLVDAGTLRNTDVGRVVADAAREVGVRRLAAACISHANFDHFSGLASALEAIPADALWLNPYFGMPGSADDDWLAHTAREIGVTRFAAGDSRDLGDVGIEVLWPPDDLVASVGANDRSLVLRLSFAGRTVLFPGDIEEYTMRSLLERHESGQLGLKSDVLIAPHHGSVLDRSSLPFYKAVAPSAVVVSTGRGRSGLADLMREAFDGSTPWYSTDDYGDVVIDIEPDGTLRVGPSAR
jgi:competence protein ComEC